MTTVDTRTRQGGTDPSQTSLPVDQPDDPAEFGHPADLPAPAPSEKTDPPDTHPEPAQDTTVPETDPAPDPDVSAPANSMTIKGAANLVLRILVAAVVLAAAFLTLTTVPRPADWDDFTRDVGAGTVSTVQVGQAWQVSSSPRTLTMTLGINPGFDRTPIVVWESHGQPWSAKIPSDQIAADATTTQQVATESTGLINETAQAADVPVPTVTLAGTQTANYVARAALCMWPVFTLFVMFGPAPRRATRAAWVWLGALPVGLGILSHLMIERPGTSTTARPVLTGGKAFILAAAANMVLLAVVTVAWAALAHP